LGTCRFVNRRLGELLLCSEEEMLGKPADQFLPALWPLSGPESPKLQVAEYQIFTGNTSKQTGTGSTRREGHRGRPTKQGQFELSEFSPVLGYVALT
jgi:PAS domain-containing protein